MKGLVFCPNGERLTPREKLVGMVLADSHQDKAKSFTYPSVETIAKESLSDKRTCQRYLDGLERKGVIVRLRPKGQGRGSLVFYFFPALDVLPEGWQGATLPDGSLFAQKGGERVAEGWRKGGRTHISPVVERAREREQQQEQEQVHPPLPPQAGDVGRKEPDDEGKTEASAASVACEKPERRSGSEPASGSADSDSETGDRAGDRTGGIEACGARAAIGGASQAPLVEEVVLTAEQLEHLEGIADPVTRRHFEQFYREENQARADKMAEAAAAARTEDQRLGL
jgi:hypothetical protein